MKKLYIQPQTDFFSVTPQMMLEGSGEGNVNNFYQESIWGNVPMRKVSKMYI